jgi:hypothetical protein
MVWRPGTKITWLCLNTLWQVPWISFLISLYPRDMGNSLFRAKLQGFCGLTGHFSEHFALRHLSFVSFSNLILNKVVVIDFQWWRSVYSLLVWAMVTPERQRRQFQFSLCSGGEKPEANMAYHHSQVKAFILLSRLKLKILGCIVGFSVVQSGGGLPTFQRYLLLPS